MLSILNPTKVATKPSFLRSSFLIAGIAFVITTIIGIALSYYIKSIVNFDSLSVGRGRFSTTFMDNRTTNNDAKILFYIVVIGGAASILSFVLTIVWMFRIMKSGKVFIYVTFITSIVAQGIGFGSLFSAFQAPELLAILGIAGGLFLSMAAVGWFVKDASKMMPYLMVGTIIIMLMSAVSIILYFVGVYNDTFFMMLTIFSGVLTLAWIVFDIWSIKRTSQWMEMNRGTVDDLDYFRLLAFFSFKLFSDLIGLVWTVARIYLRASR